MTLKYFLYDDMFYYEYIYTKDKERIQEIIKEGIWLRLSEVEPLMTHFITPSFNT
jgi:hypothetical protein